MTTAESSRPTVRPSGADLLTWVDTDLSMTGAIWSVKGKPDVFRQVHLTAKLHSRTHDGQCARVGTAEVYPPSTCAKVITSGGCTVEAPASSPDVMDPEEACQRAIEAGLVVHCAHPLNGETSIPVP